MMLWQEKAGARYMYYVLSLAWLLELIHLPPSQPKPCVVIPELISPPSSLSLNLVHPVPLLA